MSKYNKLIIFLLLIIITFTCFGMAGRTGGHALVIIDMQSYFVKRGKNHWRWSNIRKFNKLLKNQIELIKMAKKSGLPIIFVEYKHYGPTDKRLKEAVGNYAKTQYFLKQSANMFYRAGEPKNKLEKYLESQNIKNLVIAGANGGACVDSSIDHGLSENYNVVAFSKGIADFNYKNFIYPYDNIYGFKPNCDNCTFRELDELAEIDLEFARSSNRKANNSHIDDSSRNPGLGKKYKIPRDSTKGQERERSIFLQ